MVEVESLIKRYRGAQRNALDNVSFTVNAGEFFTLLGPNGAGKSTMVSILTTTLAPTSGSVRIAGLDVATQPAAVRKQVGIIFQNPSLDMNLSGEENIRLHALLYGLYPYRPSYRLMPRKYREHIGEMASVLGMESDMFRPVRKLSGGMRRKLEIIRALLHRPQVLFLDEPTTGLDVASRRSLWAYLAEIRRREDMTIVLTTHYLEEAETADRILILDHGQVVAQGAPAQVKAQFAGETLTLDAADRDILRRELTALGVPFEESGRFRVALDGTQSAHELVRSLATPLTVMQTEQASLEEAYLRILTRD
ncbi:MAG TPA: ABC transporter ATP-binding protein [Ktedonobacterales bacterium]|nr:ABC transporter ATP-binding protein [Ktedonobacterales bacterium]